MNDGLVVAGMTVGDHEPLALESDVAIGRVAHLEGHVAVPPPALAEEVDHFGAEPDERRGGLLVRPTSVVAARACRL